MFSKEEKEAFTQAVYDIVRRIPSGRATSYGAIAKAIGYPNLSRMVGRVMKGCGNYKIKLPAHRVVNSQGVLSGAEGFGYSGQMQQFLEAEGVSVVNGKIKDWKNVFWDPMTEITVSPDFLLYL